MTPTIDYLNIPNVFTTEIEDIREFQQPVRREVSAVLHAQPETCGHPNCCRSFMKHGCRNTKVKDTPAAGLPTVIDFTLPRYRCKSFGHTFSVVSSEVNHRTKVTNRALEHVSFKALSRPISQVSADTGISRSAISSVNNTLIDLMDVMYSQTAPRVLGIDEVHVGGKARAVFTDIEKRQVIDIHKQRSKDTIVEVINSWTETDGIQFVTMDMCSAYRDAVHEALPAAKIIIDKRHVLEYARRAMEEERKKVWRTYNKRKAGKSLKGKLKKICRFINSRRAELNKTDVAWMDKVLRGYPRLKQAYELKECFNHIWAATSGDHARELYAIWVEQVPEELRATFKDVFSLFNNWSDEIFAYFDASYIRDGSKSRITNAYTESANRLIKEIFRHGRGNHDFWRLRAKVLHMLGPWTEDVIRDTVGIEFDLVLRHNHSLIDVMAPVEFQMKPQ